MRKFGRTRSGKTEDRADESVQELILLLAGICSILLILRSVPHVTFSAAAVSAAVTVVCAGLYLLFRVRKKMIWAGSAGILLLCAALAAGRMDLCAAQLGALAEGLMNGSAQGETSVTFLVLLTGTALSVCFFLLEIVWKRHWLPYITVTGILAGAPIFGIRPGILPVLLGLIFQILFWTIHAAGRRKRGGAPSERRYRGAVTARCSAVMWAVLSVLACISVVITLLWGTELSAAVYEGEGFVSRTLQQITGTADEPASSGHVSSGNNYRTGEPQMEVILQAEPEETLYLKGFTGGAYAGGDWEPAEDGVIFHEMSAALGWEGWESWISGQFTSLYFAMNMRSAEDEIPPRYLFIRHIDGSYETIYTPYYSGWAQWQNTEEPGYSFEYYEGNEMDISWERSVPAEFRRARQWLKQLQNTYMEGMPEIYTQVDEELVPRLAELCSGRSFSTLDEVTAFILSTLQSDASYTLTPGRAPLNEDIVEYFLFESHEGYCVHFASAATLMYRLCGVPARYASGYALEPADFTQQEDGSWRAEVTDESAHAWTEIFLEDCGWTPVEVTPSSDGSYSTSYPGLDTDMLEEMISAAAPEQNDAAGREDPGRTETDSADESGSILQEFSDDLSGYRRLIPAAAAVILLCAALSLYLRRRFRRRQAERMDCRGIFGRFLEMLRCAGYMSGCTGAEEGFAEALSARLPCLSREEAERLVGIVSRAAYGSGGPREEENEFAREIYFRTEGWIRKELKGLHRLRFKYIGGF